MVVVVWNIIKINASGYQTAISYIDCSCKPYKYGIVIGHHLKNTGK